MRREVIASSKVHAQSRLLARLEDDGTCGHVLIYKVGKRKEEYAALWIYNRTAEPMESETPSDFPPADRECVGAGAICERPEVSAWTFLWSATGEAVALAQDGRLVGFIDLAENSPTQANCCRNLVSGVNWGEP